MKVAVAYNNGQIGEHFGHAECFAIYDYQDTNVDSCVKKLIDCTDRHGHQAMADLMRENDVDAVIVSQMGDEARALLLSAGIVPVLGYCGGADMAADMLVSGLLSISPEFDGGGCGGGSEDVRSEQSGLHGGYYGGNPGRRYVGFDEDCDGPGDGQE